MRLILALAFLLSPAVFAQDYAIKLARPKKAGEEYKLEATMSVSQDMTTTTNGVESKSNKKEIAIQCEGVFKVIEAGSDGVETKSSITIDKFTKTEDGKSAELLPKGAVIVSTLAKDVLTHEVDGKPAPPQILEFLSQVSSLSKSGAKDDATFGTKERKKKAATWDADGTLAKKDFEQSASGLLQLESYAGKASLDDVTGETMTVSVHFTGSCLPPLPPSFTVDKSALETSFSGIFPVDVSKPRIQASTKVSFSFTAHKESPGEKIVIHMQTSQSALQKMTPLK